MEISVWEIVYFSGCKCQKCDGKTVMLYTETRIQGIWLQLLVAQLHKEQGKIIRKIHIDKHKH